MKYKYLTKEGIEEEYNSRKSLTNALKITGVIGGGVIALLGVGSDNLGEMLTGGGVTTFSYIFGSSFDRINEKRKDKYIKNIEDKSLSA
jgi:hypothetical protein